MMSTGLDHLIASMQATKERWRMGHDQDHQSADIGLGWLYYGMARSLQPSLAVVIGSWRGFVPILIVQALQDTVKGGRLLFVDPSLADDQWEEGVDDCFQSFGIHCVTHYQQKSENFWLPTILT